MGGKVLEYEAKTILRKGIKAGKIEAYHELINDGFLTVEEAAKRVDMTVEEFQKELQKTNA